MPYSSVQRHHHNLCLSCIILVEVLGHNASRSTHFMLRTNPENVTAILIACLDIPFPQLPKLTLVAMPLSTPPFWFRIFPIGDEQCRPWSNLESHHNKPVSRHTICCSSVIPAPWPHLISALLPLSWFSLAPGCPRTPLPFYSILALTPIRLRKILRPWSISAAEAKEVLLVFAHSPGTEYGC